MFYETQMATTLSRNTIRTICPLCPCQDGLVATVEKGKITKIEGDKAHAVSRGYACLKGRHSMETIHHPDRFRKPILKTASGWKEVSWDEALDIAAARFGETKARFGPYSFCAAQCFPMLPDGIAMTMFTRSMGSPNQMNDIDLCQGTHEIADIATCGAVISIYQSAEDFRNSKCILLVGSNMAVSAGGQWQDILHSRKNGASLIVVDPRRSESAQDADLWLQIRPGSDGALALGILNVIINEDLYDKEFVSNYCVGFDKLREHIQQYPPEKVAEITWLKADDIRKAARLFATTKPACYRGNNGVSQHSNSTQSARAFSILIAITGNIDVPGGNLIPTPAQGYSGGGRLLQETRLHGEVEEKRLGAERFPLWSGPNSLMMSTAHNPTVLNAMITGEPYPVKSMLVCNANPVVTYPDTKKVVEALKKLEFLAVIGMTPSPTSDLADLILPMKHAYEHNRVTFSGYGNWISAMPKLVDAPENCFDVIHIVRALSDRMVQKGYITENLIPWRNIDEFNDWRISKTGFSFSALCQKSPLLVERHYRKYAQFGFRTPSGKVELYSTLLEKYGYDPLPTYREPGESPFTCPGLAEKYPLLLTTRRSKNYWLSRSSEEGWLRKLTHYPTLQLHPQTAAERQIQDKDMVLVETPRGGFRHIAELTEDIHPKVVCGAFGWWLPEKKAVLAEGAFEVNANAVMSYDAPCDPVVGINSVQAVLCQVSKVAK